MSLLTNFRNYRRVGNDCTDWRYYAAVDVVDGALWWRRTRTRDISRRFAGAGWFFVDNGDYADADRLERAENARRGMRGEPTLDL